MASHSPIQSDPEGGFGLDNTYDVERDPSLKLSNQRVKEAREAVLNGTDRVYRIYTDGIFDLFHVGHMQMLKQAKHALGNPKNVCLVAGVCTDADTRKYKGKNVMDEKIRTESVKHCKWVDEVVEGPWVLTEDFIQEHQIDFVAHDAIPYVSEGIEDCYAYVKSQGKFLATQRTNGISTTDLIVQIVRDYDDHVVRNLKRGVDKKSLNLGRTWAIRAVAHQKEQRLKSTLDHLKAEQQQVLQSLKSLTMCLNNNNNNRNNNNNDNNNNNNNNNNKNTTITSTTTRKLSPLPSSTQEEEGDELAQKQKQHPSQQQKGSTTALFQEDDINTSSPQPKLCTELTNVAKHSYNLCAALTNTGLAALGYFNIFSYITMYQQTNQSKKD